MKKRWIYGLLITAAVLAFGITMVACDSGGDDGERYEPMIIRGTAGGRPTELEISTNRTVPRNVLTPASGDSYVLRYLNPTEVISQGSIQVDPNGVMIRFNPSGSGESFSGSFSGGLISIPSIPGPGGTTLSFTPAGGGTTPGGGNGGTTTSTNGTPQPVTITITPTSANINSGVGGKVNFSATVNNNSNQVVDWSVTAGTAASVHAGTDIDSSGELTVDAGQAEGTIIVRATWDGNSSIYRDATVTIAVFPTLVGDVTITTPNNVPVQVGVLLTAAYAGKSNPDPGPGEANGTGTPTWVWLRGTNTTPIATGNTYTPQAADAEEELTARVEFGNTTGHVENKTAQVLPEDCECTDYGQCNGGCNDCECCVCDTGDCKNTVPCVKFCECCFETNCDCDGGDLCTDNGGTCDCISCDCDDCN